ncbi:MAG: C45 family autoproteolytic acyltransferase/hydrolase, partial [Spirochaetes bacterium]|nr:C45 family autoproteolytic acyltransferase/hydrolase [Spirochaetota bacterium]
MKLVKIKGSPAEMGLQYGRECKKLIEKSLNTWYRFAAISQTSGFQSGYPTLREVFPLLFRFRDKIPDLQKRALKYEPYIKKNWPEVVDFMRGIADGAGKEYRDILFLNTFSEVCEGCTSWVSTGQASKEAMTYIGMDVDEDRQVKNTQIILDVNPEKGNRYMGTTYAGLIAPINGMNEAGVAFTTMLLITKRVDSKIHIPLYPTLYSVIKSADSAEEAATHFEKHTPGIGTASCLFFADSQKAYRLENVPVATNKTLIEDDVCACTMRPLSKEIKPYDNAENVAPIIEMNAVERSKRLPELLIEQ